MPSAATPVAHDFLDLRDNQIAHSVNDWEINTPVARVRIDGEAGALGAAASPESAAVTC